MSTFVSRDEISPRNLILYASITWQQ